MIELVEDIDHPFYYQFDRPSPAALYEELAHTYRPPSSQPVSEWARENVRLPAESTAEPGRYNPDRTPYIVEILNLMADTAVKKIIMMCSTQVAKSTFQHLGLLWTIDQSPGPVLIVMPTEQVVGEMFDERIKPMLRASPRLKRHLTGKKVEWKAKKIKANGATVYIGWAGSEAITQSKAIKLALLDESSIWEVKANAPDQMKSIEQRLRTYKAEGKTASVSTPKVPGDLICREFDESDRRHYWVACPHCAERQILEFNMERVRVPKGVRDPKVIRASKLATYHCIACDEAIPDSAKEEMLRGGVWCPEGNRVAPNGKIIGDVPLDSSVRGYHLNALYSPWCTWSDVAAAFFEALRDKAMQAFYNFWLGLPFEQTEKAPEFEQLKALKKEYAHGSVPAGTVILTAGIDWGKKVKHWSIWAWKHGLCISLVAAGEAKTYEELDAAVFDSTFVSPEGYHFKVDSALFDEGDGNSTEEVRNYCRSNPKCEPCKGRDTLAGESFQYKNQEKDRDGKRIEGGLMVTHVNTDMIKTQLVARLKQEDNSFPIEFPADLPDRVLKSFMAEQRVIVKNKAGTTKAAWRVRSGYSGINHWFDTAVYAIAMGYRLSLQWQLHADSAPPKPQVAEPPKALPTHSEDRFEKRDNRAERRQSGSWRAEDLDGLW